MSIVKNTEFSNTVSLFIGIIVYYDGFELFLLGLDLS
jgi:hypothetical protein